MSTETKSDARIVDQLATERAPLQITERPASERAARHMAERVARVINDPTIKSTEVIRDGGFVYGRVAPITKTTARW